MTKKELPINTVVCGDALEIMKTFPSNSIDCCITSPPYWGLRDYGFVQIFGGDKDCKHDFGVIHRRAGDKSGPHGPGSILGPTKHAQHDVRMGEPTKTCSKCKAWRGQLGLEPTPEMYIEHLKEIFNEIKRVLKKEGTLWLNIGDTYSGSPAGDTAGKSHTGRFKLGYKNQETRIARTKHRKMTLPGKCMLMIPERLAWSLIQNGWILRNKIIWYKPNSMPSSVTDRFSNRWEYLFMFSKSQRYFFDLDAVREPHALDNIGVRPSKLGCNPKYQNKGPGYGATQTFNPLGKNLGDVFEINTQPFPDTHFAVFPEKLCEKPIKAGCPEDGIVLDPFAGAGTALYVAKEMRRRFIGIDIKQEYCDMAETRTAQGVL